ncbi:MAG: DNA (cytosine-5-)-methyltransferase [Albidovulum sp.]|nr:DNA (cytosine-5-)-methyltransferase [Albidovulum sp.]
MNYVTCIDLFCGAGGLAHGLQKEGINVVAGVDIAESCRYPFEFNNFAKFIKKDVSEFSADQLNHLYGKSEIKVLAGCAPCQPFSTYSQRYDVLNSPRWGLLYQFDRLIKEIRPDLVTMENVPTVAKHEVFNDFVASIREQGYQVHQEIIDCSMYGLPQARIRMVVLASRLGPIEIVSPDRTISRTVRDAIGELPPITNGDGYYDDVLHKASKLSRLNVERIRASRPGGSWRDWPDHLIAACHRKETGRSFSGVYGRMEWDRPSPTLTTQFYGFGNGRFGHPDQERAISLREGAILQGFPISYSLVPEGAPIHFKTLGRMIGNAVPVTLGEVIGRSINRHLGEEFLAQPCKKEEDQSGQRTQAFRDFTSVKEWRSTCSETSTKPTYQSFAF